MNDKVSGVAAFMRAVRHMGNAETCESLLQSLTNEELYALRGEVHGERERRINVRVREGKFPAPTDLEAEEWRAGSHRQALTLYRDRTGEHLYEAHIFFGQTVK